MNRTSMATAAATAACALAPAAALAQNICQGTAIRMVVPATPGGSTDVAARYTAERLSAVTGETVIIDNKPGAAQTLGAGIVARSAPNGCTLFFGGNTAITTSPHTMKPMPYDVKKDFAPVAHMALSGGLAIYVHSSVPAKNLSELARVARERKEPLAYSSYGIGSAAHVVMELVNKELAVQMTHVPYAGTAQQLQDLASGVGNVAASAVSTAVPFVTSGKIRPIGLAGTKRSNIFPDVPTFTEQGVTIETGHLLPWFGVFAPAGTPAPILEKLSAHLMKVARSPEYMANMTQIGAEATGYSLTETRTLTFRQYDQWGELLRKMEGTLR